jgi:hypothetical protein
VFFEFKVDGEVYRINPEPTKLTGAELLAVERHTGLGMMDFVEALKNPHGSTAGITALVWLARRRSGDFIKWESFVETFHPLTLDLEIVEDEPDSGDKDEPPAEQQKPVAAAKPRASRPRSRAKTS